MPHGYLKHAAKGDVSRRAMRGGGSGKSLGSGGSARRRMKEIKLGADGTKKGSRGPRPRRKGRPEARHDVRGA